jgi:hypothetical protein
MSAIIVMFLFCFLYLHDNSVNFMYCYTEKLLYDRVIKILRIIAPHITHRYKFMDLLYVVSERERDPTSG